MKWLLHSTVLLSLLGTSSCASLPSPVMHLSDAKYFQAPAPPDGVLSIRLTAGFYGVVPSLIDGCVRFQNGAVPVFDHMTEISEDDRGIFFREKNGSGRKHRLNHTASGGGGQLPGEALSSHIILHNSSDPSECPGPYVAFYFND